MIHYSFQKAFIREKECSKVDETSKFQKIDRNTLTNFKPEFPRTKNKIEIKEPILLDSPLTLLEKQIEIEKHSKVSVQIKEMFRRRSSVIMIQSLIRGCLKRVGYYSLKKSYQVNATIIQRGIRGIFSRKATLLLRQTNISIVELQRIVRGAIARMRTGRKLKIIKEETINSNNNHCCRFQSKKVHPVGIRLSRWKKILSRMKQMNRKLRLDEVKLELKFVPKIIFFQTDIIFNQLSNVLERKLIRVQSFRNLGTNIGVYQNILDAGQIVVAGIDSKTRTAFLKEISATKKILSPSVACICVLQDGSNMFRYFHDKGLLHMKDGLKDMGDKKLKELIVCIQQLLRKIDSKDLRQEIFQNVGEEISSTDNIVLIIATVLLQPKYVFLEPLESISSANLKANKILFLELDKLIPTLLRVDVFAVPLYYVKVLQKYLQKLKKVRKVGLMLLFHMIIEYIVELSMILHRSGGSPDKWPERNSSIFDSIITMTSYHDVKYSGVFA